MARAKYVTKTVRRKPQPAKKWQMFESVITDKKGHVRLFDRASVKLRGRSATRRTGTSYDYVGRGYRGAGPWRPKLHPRGAGGRFVKK